MTTPIPNNRARFELEQIAELCSGTSSSSLSGQLVYGISTDSRQDLRGKLFVALRGERFDGHRFLRSAVQAGALAVVVEEDTPKDLGVPALRVQSTLEALGDLAREHRRRWGGQVVAVAGSAGKTTTRAAIEASLAAVVGVNQVLAPVGNLNNRIGVPMVLLGLEPHHRIAVIEFGTNYTGEVQILSELAEPGIGVLTLVALEHCEGLGDLDAIEQEEGALLRCLPGQGLAVANGDDPRALRQMRNSPARGLSYGFGPDCGYRIHQTRVEGLRGTEIMLTRPGGSMSFSVPILGAPGALAAAAALAVADHVSGGPLSAEDLKRALAVQRFPGGRMRPFLLSDQTVVLDDSYNANPASMKAALATACGVAEERRSELVLILGEMRELGAYSLQAHRELAVEVVRCKARNLIAVGGHAQHYLKGSKPSSSVFVETAAEAEALLSATIGAGDVVLIKASHGLHLEQLVQHLVKSRGLAA